MVARVRGDVERPGHPVGSGAAIRRDRRSRRCPVLAAPAAADSTLRPGDPAIPRDRRLPWLRAPPVGPQARVDRRDLKVLQGRLVPERRGTRRPAATDSTRPPSSPGDSARRSRRPAGSRFPSGRRTIRSGEPLPPPATAADVTRAVAAANRYPACVRARILLSSLTRLVVASLRGAARWPKRTVARNPAWLCGDVDASTRTCDAIPGPGARGPPVQREWPAMHEPLSPSWH